MFYTKKILVQCSWLRTLQPKGRLRTDQEQLHSINQFGISMVIKFFVFYIYIAYYHETMYQW